MRIAQLSSMNQRQQTNKQSFGILKPVEISNDLKVLLKNDSDIEKLQEVLNQVSNAQAKNNFCDVDFFVSKGVTPLPSGPSINVVADKAGVVLKQLNIKQEAYKGLSPIDAIVKMFEDASEFATKIKEA